MIIEWGSDTYRQIRRKFEDTISTFPSVYNNEVIVDILAEYNGRIIELRPKPMAIREIVDFMGLNHRYAIEFDNDEDALLFLMRYA